ncbi:MAG TPA: hypothetical protein VK835_15415, partial [Bacteroidia bacterium]|nr:hypothetical protein [Bacteroidia bacterium]
MKKISHRLKQVKVNAHTIVQIVFIFWLLVFTNKASAQENHGEEGEKVRDTTYIFPTATFYPSVITLGNGQNERDAQGLTIVDHADVRVLSSSFFQQSEPHISIDRNNPQNLILSANNQNLNTGLEDQGYYYSNNGGSTWTGNDHFPGPLTIPGIGAARSGGDPSTAFNLNGDAFISTLELKFRGFFSATSLAGSSAGSTWSTPTYIVDPISFDKEMIAADNIANSPYANSLYCVGTEFFDNAAALCIDPSAPTANLSFFRSTDNWATSSRIADLRNNANGYGDGANVQTGPNGEVFVCWTDLPNNSLPSSNIGFAYSADGGLTFSNSSNAIFTSTQYAGGVLMNCDQDFSTNIIHDPKFGVAQQTYGPAGAIYNSQHVDGTG